MSWTQSQLRELAARALTAVTGQPPTPTEIDAILPPLPPTPPTPDLPLSDCIAAFLSAKARDGTRPNTLYVYRLRLTPFLSAFGSRLPNSPTLPELTAYLARWPHLTTRRGHWSTLSTLYTWLIAQGLAPKNLIREALARPRPIPRTPPIYTLDEVRQILLETLHTDQLGFWVLSLFAGLRASEIRRLSQHPAPWSLLNFSRSELILPDPYKPRTLRLPPVLLTWLHHLQRHAQPFYPINHAPKYARLQALTGTARGLNRVRPTYLAYRLALTSTAPAHTADECSLSEKSLFASHRHKATRAAAQTYFALTPARLQNSLQFQLKLNNIPPYPTPMASRFETEMIELFLDAAALFSVPKSVASIYGLLFASPQPLSFSDIESRLKLSKGSVSQGLRLLREIDAIQEVSTPSDRVERFIPNTEMRILIDRFLEQRLEQQLLQGKLRLTSLKISVEDFAPPDQSAMKGRVEKLQRWHDRTRALIPVVKTFLKLTKI